MRRNIRASNGTSSSKPRRGDEQASLYLGIHDPRGTTTVHGSQPRGPEGETVGLAIRRLDAIRSGEKITWSARLAVGDGGWHQGARLYGDRFTAVHGSADYPDWLRTSLGWLDLNVQNYGADFRFAQLAGLIAAAGKLFLTTGDGQVLCLDAPQ